MHQFAYFATEWLQHVDQFAVIWSRVVAQLKQHNSCVAYHPLAYRIALVKQQQTASLN
jgi:hypothetical protein